MAQLALLTADAGPALAGRRPAAPTRQETLAHQGRSLTVTATGFSHHERGQTRTAWGERLTPGIKAIAVSPDLLAMGLKRNTVVRISGLPGQYVVKDKMSPRLTRHVDIYFGDDARAMRLWGRKKVVITWEAP